MIFYMSISYEKFNVNFMSIISVIIHQNTLIMLQNCHILQKYANTNFMSEILFTQAKHLKQ